MQQGHDFRRIVFRMAEASQSQKKRSLKVRETFDTMILGTVSTSVGVVILIVGILGWRGAPVPWADLAVASIVGEVLGVAGLAVGKLRNDSVSPLSAVGTVICLIHMYLFFGQFLLGHFS